jgi:hypothetical protein
MTVNVRSAVQASAVTRTNLNVIDACACKQFVCTQLRAYGLHHAIVQRKLRRKLPLTIFQVTHNFRRNCDYEEGIPCFHIAFNLNIIFRENRMRWSEFSSQCLPKNNQTTHTCICSGHEVLNKTY